MTNSNYQLNTKQAGEALELLTGLADNSADLVLLDPQYEKVSQVLKMDYPLQPQSDYQILRIIEQINRVLKPSSFCLLWINKALLGSDRIANWLIKATSLRIVDCLVWYKKNTLGLGTWLRSNAEFCFLVQKYPTTGKKFTNRSVGTVWAEDSLPTQQRKHPHQKPRELLKTLLLATTQENDLVVEPCAGSFILLDLCQQLNRNYLGVDLTFKEMTDFAKNRHSQMQEFKNERIINSNNNRASRNEVRPSKERSRREFSSKGTERTKLHDHQSN